MCFVVQAFASRPVFVPLTQPDDERVTANAIGKAVILRDEQSSGVRAVPTHGTGNYKAKVRVQLEVCQNAVRWWLAAQIETDGDTWSGTRDYLD